MRKEIREEILTTAKVLFMENGYHGVSMQDIADAVGISKGNLTYHFPKKENIMEALLIPGHAGKEITVPGTLEQLDTAFRNMQQVLEEHAYYFLYYTELSQLSPQIAETQRQAYQKKTQLLQEGFSRLHAAGVLRDELFEGEYDSVIDTLHMVCIYWGSYWKAHDQYTMEFRERAWKIMYPLLTEQGQQQFRDCGLSAFVHPA